MKLPLIFFLKTYNLKNLNSAILLMKYEGTYNFCYAKKKNR